MQQTASAFPELGEEQPWRMGEDSTAGRTSRTYPPTPGGVGWGLPPKGEPPRRGARDGGAGCLSLCEGACGRRHARAVATFAAQAVASWAAATPGSLVDPDVLDPGQSSPAIWDGRECRSAPKTPNYSCTVLIPQWALDIQ